MKFIENFKRGLSYFTDKLVKNSNYIYTFSVILIVNAFIWLNVSIKNSTDLLKSKSEKAVLILELNQSKFLLNESSKAFDWQWDIIHKQRQELDKASQVIENQDSLLQKIIRYLKETDQWPPKIKPVDPDKLASAESI